MKFTKLIMVLSIILFTLLYAQSLDEHKMDCDAGNAQACYQAAETYTSMSYGEKKLNTKKIPQEKVNLYKKSCELGYAEGCTQYAIRYAADDQKNRDKDDAYYFKKACEMGDETGCTMLKMMAFRQ